MGVLVEEATLNIFASILWRGQLLKKRGANCLRVDPSFQRAILFKEANRISCKIRIWEDFVLQIVGWLVVFGLTVL